MISDIPPILTYHSVDSSNSATSLAPAEFEKQMAYIQRKGYCSITLAEMVTAIKSGQGLSGKNIVLTFDDGYENTATIARPILEKYGLTATIFVVTSYVGHPCGWESREAISELRLATWDEIGDMHGHGFDIQPHSCSHPLLSRLTDDKIWQEVTISKQEIEKRLNKTCTSFCYPYGDYDDRVVALLKQAGYLAAVTIEFGRRNCKDDLYRLRRLGSAHFADSMFRFGASLAGIYERYLGAKQWLFRTL